MFRIALLLFGFLVSSLWRPDDPPAGPPQDDPADDPPSGPPSDEIVLKFTDEAARQEWLDRQFGERYKRKQAEIREQERTAVEAELAEKQAAEKEDWKEHSRIVGEKLDAANARIRELESGLENARPDAERLRETESVLVDLIGPQLERVPDHYRFWIDKATAVEKAKWLAENRDKLGEPQDPVGSPPSPGAARRDNGREQREADKDAAESQRIASFRGV